MRSRNCSRNCSRWKAWALRTLPSSDAWRICTCRQARPRAAPRFFEDCFSSPRDADALTGLGGAEFTMGNYRASAANYRRVVRLEPKNQAALRRLQLVTQVLALDPMQRSLGSTERQRRAAALLQLSLDVAERCAGTDTSGALRGAIDSAQTALRTLAPAARRDSVFQANLDLAERLRGLRPQGCEPTTAAERALDLVVTKLGD